MPPISSNHTLAGLDALPAKRAAEVRKETNRATKAMKMCIPTAVVLGLVITTPERLHGDDTERNCLEGLKHVA